MGHLLLNVRGLRPQHSKRVGRELQGGVRKDDPTLQVM